MEILAFALPQLLPLCVKVLDPTVNLGLMQTLTSLIACLLLAKMYQPLKRYFGQEF